MFSHDKRNVVTRHTIYTFCLEILCSLWLIVGFKLTVQGSLFLCSAASNTFFRAIHCTVSADVHQVSYNLSALNSKGSLAFLIATWFNPLNARLLFFCVSVSISVRDDKECTKLFPNSITLTAHFFSHVCAVQGQTYAAGLMAPLCLCLSHICLWALMSFLCLVKMWLGSLQQISVLFCFSLFNYDDGNLCSSTVYAGQGTLSSDFTQVHADPIVMCPHTNDKKKKLVHFTVH